MNPGGLASLSEPASSQPLTLENKMKLKLCLRVAVLTGMLFVLVSTFNTQPCAACSPGWYEGCISSCDRAFHQCTVYSGVNCNPQYDSCTNNCNSKLAKCYAMVVESNN